jgi:hypothetical protein
MKSLRKARETVGTLSGVPRPATGKTPIHNFRAPKDLWDEAAAIAEARNETMTDVLVRALRAYIRRHRTGSGI